MLTYLLTLLLSASLLEAQAAPLLQRDPEIREAVTSYIKQKTSQLGYEIHIKKLTLGGPTELPGGSVDFEVVASQQWEGWGIANIAVIVRQGNRVVRNIPVRVEVEALADMVVALHQIDRDSVISSDDVVIKRADISGIQGKYLGRTSDVIGKKARATLRANTPLKPDQLEKVALIKSGQPVTIQIESGNMRITVTGKARSAGAAGEMIRVQNLESLKEFPARILDARTVAILL